jgi:hypothetical protein
MERGAGQWRRRWFVKPGLTGLAQIRGATGHEPGAKLRHDIEYIRRQSFWFDLKIVIRQIWLVIQDAYRFVRFESEPDDSGDEHTREKATRDVEPGQCRDERGHRPDEPSRDTSGATDVRSISESSPSDER